MNSTTRSHLLAPLAFALLPALAQATPQFGDVVELTLTNYFAKDTCLIDADQDGDLDLAIASFEPGRGLVLENLGAERVRALDRFDDYGDTALVILPFDVDEDGVEDLILGANLPTSLKWKRGSGQGDFGPPQLIANISNRITGAVARDLDGDGRDDLVLSKFTGLVWLPNLAPGQFGPEQSFGPAGSYIDLSVEDMDGDGDADVVAAETDVYEINYVENLGGGSFAPGVVLATSTQYPSSVLLVDVDADGDRDVVTCWEGSGSIGLVESLGAGSFGTESLIVTGIQRPSGGIFSDINGDGNLDLIFRSAGNGLVYSSSQTTSGTFGAPVSLNLPAVYARALNLVDMDGNGTEDIVVTKSASTYVIPRFPTAPFLGQPYEATLALDGARYGAAADLDGDGDLDALSGAIYSGLVASFTNEGGGTFDEGRVVVDGVTNIFDIAAGDVTGDGIQDLVFTTSLTGSSVQLAVGAGDATFGTPSVIAPLAATINTLELGDLDGDGDVDVVVAEEAGSLFWYATLPGGTFSQRIIIDPTPGRPTDLGLADVDGDGQLDVTAICSNSFRWWRNLGPSGFSHPIQMSGIVDFPLNGELADLDGDGDLDAAWCNGFMFWAPNLGTAGFGPRTRLTTVSTADLALVDVDLDGDVDIVGFGQVAAPPARRTL